MILPQVRQRLYFQKAIDQKLPVFILHICVYDKTFIPVIPFRRKRGSVGQDEGERMAAGLSANEANLLSTTSFQLFIDRAIRGAA